MDNTANERMIATLREYGPVYRRGEEYWVNFDDNEWDGLRLRAHPVDRGYHYDLWTDGKLLSYIEEPAIRGFCAWYRRRHWRVIGLSLHATHGADIIKSSSRYSPKSAVLAWLLKKNGVRPFEQPSAALRDNAVMRQRVALITAYLESDGDGYRLDDVSLVTRAGVYVWAEPADKVSKVVRLHCSLRPLFLENEKQFVHHDVVFYSNQSRTTPFTNFIDAISHQLALPNELFLLVMQYYTED